MIPRRQQGLRRSKDICPAPPGGEDWQPSAFSPKTGLLYIPHNNLCFEEQGTQANYIAGTPYVGLTCGCMPGKAATAASSRRGIQ